MLTNKGSWPDVHVDTSGKVIKGPVPIYEGYRLDDNKFDCFHLRDNMVMILLSVAKINSSDYSDRIGAYVVVR